MVNLHQEHRRLDDSWHLDHVEMTDFCNRLIKDAFCWFKHLRLCSHTQFAQFKLLLLFINWFWWLRFLWFLNVEDILDSFVDDLGNSLLKLLLNSWVTVQQLNASVAVLSQALDLGALPLLSENLNALKNLSALILTDLAVLAHSIDADNEFLLNTVEWLEIKLLNLFLLHDVGFTIGNGSIHLCLLVSVVSGKLAVKTLVFSSDLEVVSNCGVKSFIGETGVIDDWN